MSHDREINLALQLVDIDRCELSLLPKEVDKAF